MFSADADKQETVVAKLQLALNDAIKQSATCKSEQNQLSNNLEVAQKDLLDETNQFNKKDADLSEEISIFNEVLDLYVTSTYSQDEDFKARQDDYIDDGTFDDDKYDERKVP